jgi:hypothetical protein
MSLLIRVELPTYSHSFQISVPSTGTIDDVKREIEKVCSGNPRVHGQRLIWRGRFLGDDEKVLDIWKVRRPSQLPASGPAHGTNIGRTVTERFARCTSFSPPISLGQRTS